MYKNHIIPAINRSTSHNEISKYSKHKQLLKQLPIQLLKQPSLKAINPIISQCVFLKSPRQIGDVILCPILRNEERKTINIFK